MTSSFLIYSYVFINQIVSCKRSYTSFLHILISLKDGEEEGGYCIPIAFASRFRMCERG
jgi:hypothetical protein